ncbi:hypothetical protein D3C85_715510 [compost metagenome]
MSSNSEILSTYSPEDVVVVISNGSFSHSIAGFADGTFINITREVPASTLYVGSDLSNARVVRGNKASTITLSLHQASSSNDVLSQLLSNDEQARDNTWLFSLTIKDNTGRSLYFSRQAFISAEPDRSFSTGIENRDWGIQCVSLQGTTGGNGQFDPATADSIVQAGGSIEERWRP